MKKLNLLPATSNETDAQINKKLKDRFSILEAMTNAAIDGDVKSLIISGPAGLGKSFTVEKAIEDWDPEQDNHTVIRGYVKDVEYHTLQITTWLTMTQMLSLVNFNSMVLLYSSLTLTLTLL